MPPRRGRPRKGDRRIDAAIDHFAAMGYAARDVRAAIAELLEVYGGPAAWPLLEENSYEVVHNSLFEKEDEEKQKQDQQPLPLEHKQQEADQQVGEESPQHQEPEADEAPSDKNMLLEVHNEVTAETESVDEELEDPMVIEPPALEVVTPLSAAIRAATARRPCHGWLSESEDEELPAGQLLEVHVSSPGGVICKRKRV